MKNIILILLFGILTISSCSKESTFAQDLQGTWQLEDNYYNNSIRQITFTYYKDNQGVFSENMFGTGSDGEETYSAESIPQFYILEKNSNFIQFISTLDYSFNTKQKFEILELNKNRLVLNSYYKKNEKEKEKISTIVFYKI